MIRALSHLFICLTISLMLAIIGAQAAVARLVMAVDAATTTEVVICGASGAHRVTLDAAGVPVPQKAPHSCASCPDSALAAAVLPKQNPQPACVETTADLSPSLTRPSVPPVRVTGRVQPRAPPKEY
jgi:hypothetical protein